MAFGDFQPLSGGINCEASGREPSGLQYIRSPSASIASKAGLRTMFGVFNQAMSTIRVMLYEPTSPALHSKPRSTL